MTIAITGASSYVGRSLINNFLAKGYNVIGISRNDPSIHHTNFTYLCLDLEVEILDIECDLLVHSAGESSLNLDFEIYYKKNINITYNIKQFIKNRDIVTVFLSSHKVYGKVYGNNNMPYVDENSDIINPCNYGLSKLCAERVLSDTVILRLPALLGKGTNGWLSKIIFSLQLNHDIKMYNHLYNNLLHLSDLANFIEIIYKKHIKKDVYVLSANDPIPSKDIVMYLKKRFNSNSKIIIQEGYSYYFFNKKMNKIYKPMSVIDTVNCYLEELN